ncbi:MAG: hypothetical protein IJ653_06350 [Bacteroidales bacterium]|nr:hypothetical protein [Bacteroidales bacterium]
MDFYKITHIGILKTLWFNFRMFPFRQAARLPVVLARNVRVSGCKRGSIVLPDNGSFHVGFHGYAAANTQKSVIHIEGKLILKGSGFHVFAPGLVMRIARGGTLQIGNNFSCHRNNSFLVNKSVIVGDENMWSFENVIMDTDAHVMFDADGVFLNPNKEVVIGDNVWVGCRNTILKGAHVPDGCVLGSGGTVTKILDKPRSIYLGNTLLKENVIWSRSRNLEGIDHRQQHEHN